MMRFYMENALQRGMKFKFPYTCSKIFLLVSMMFGLLFTFSTKSYLIVFHMLQMKSLDLDLSMFLDWISLLFFSVLCLMVSCVLKFSCIYMENDMFKMRFTWLVLTFVFSMGCLIFIPHFFFLLVGWDGLGITSFLLVIYYLSDSSWAAGMKTYLINRVGDSFFIMGLILFLSKGYWDVNTVNDKKTLSLIMVLGCFTKSAQFPFSSWLPAAMAAPTPVSSLVHSSTLVTAGMYLMVRFSNMFPPWLFMVIGVSGMWTLYSASLAACCEYDGKKMVAYSTLSQLGLMSVAISLNLPIMAFFHLMTHAMFKALMFICVGYFMNKSGHFQDLRSLKGLWKKSPMLSIILMMSKFSLLGFPFLAGFFSKELMMENNMLMINPIFHSLLLLSLPLTSYYSCRLSFNILKGCNYNSMTCKKDNNVLLFSVLPLFAGSMFMGSALYPNFYSISSLYPCHLMKLCVSLFILSGVMFSWLDIKIKNNSLVLFFSSMCFLVPFNSSFWKNMFAKSGSQYFLMLDTGKFSQFIYYMDQEMNKAGMRLFTSMQYFLSPKVGYYMMSMLGLSSLMGIMS